MPLENIAVNMQNLSERRSFVGLIDKSVIII